MSDKIIAAVEDETGQSFDATKIQIEQMASTKDEAGVIAAIPDKLARAARILADGYGLESAPLAMVARAIGLQEPMRRARASNFKDIIQVMTDDQLIELGRLLERQEAPGDWWVDLYREAKGTEPDAEGLAWWQARVRRLFIEGI